MYITKERTKEILTRYKTDNGLFNWCEEYKDFISSCVCGCVTCEVEYILKRSYEDKNTPLNYEDLNLFDIDKAREHLNYLYDEKEEEFKTYANDKTTFNRKVENEGDFEVFLNSLDKEELKEIFNKFDIDLSSAEVEILEWWIIQDPLKYRLEQEGEIFLKGGCVDFWGRCTSGQSISLDGCCINAFINLLKDNQ